MTFDYQFSSGGGSAFGGKSKKVAVLGFGIEGENAVEFLLKQGAYISVFDEKPETEFDPKNLDMYKKSGVIFSFGSLGDLKDFDVIVRSPGIHPEKPSIKLAKERGVPITTGIDIFLNLTPAYVIGVTGTKGKGTTSTLIYEMLKREKNDVFLGGNIGTPPLSFLGRLTVQSIVVLELSSFQLFDVTKSPNIAVVLMTTSEHLDVHSSEDEYVMAKANILKFQKTDDFAVINVDYQNSFNIGKVARARVFSISRNKKVSPGAYVEGGEVFFSAGGGSSSGGENADHDQEKIIETKDVFIPGEHNLENVCAAVVVAKLLNISTGDIVEVLKSFKGLTYRLQFIAEINGVRYYNDSFGTTPESAIAALHAFRVPKVLILGGSVKGSDFSELAKAVAGEKNVKAIIGIGVEWPKIKEALESVGGLPSKVVEGCGNMKEIVRAAADLAEVGDVVLLAPACASFDMFKNYKDRGKQFDEAVMALKKTTQ